MGCILMPNLHRLLYPENLLQSHLTAFSGRKDVRVYYFCQETGVYQGEGFEDEDNVGRLTGVTTIAPPSYGKGEAPFFDVSARRWTLRPVHPGPGASRKAKPAK